MVNDNNIEQVREVVDDSGQGISDEELQFTDDNRYDDLRNTYQYRQWDVTPDAKIEFPDINRDVVNANLSDVEIEYIRLCESLIGKVDFLIKKGYDELTNLKRYLNREVAFILTSSLSRDGFLREQTNTITNRLVRGMERNKPKKRTAFGMIPNNDEQQ